MAGGGALIDLSVLVPLLVGTGLGVSSACMLNNYFDRELDRYMSRTKDRPLPAGRLPPAVALIGGVMTGGSGVMMLALYVHPICAGLLLFSILNYALIYTLWLKRSTPYSTEIVGLSGALAPVIGCVAVTGEVTLHGAGLFLLLFLWQPSHFWTLGILYREDYERADLPRYPVVHGPEQTRKRLLGYTILLLPVTFGFVLTSSFGFLYLLGSAVLGGVYLLMTIRFVTSELTRRSTLTLFFSSVVYLILTLGWMFITSA